MALVINRTEQILNKSVIIWQLFIAYYRARLEVHAHAPAKPLTYSRRLISHASKPPRRESELRSGLHGKGRAFI